MLNFFFLFLNRQGPSCHFFFFLFLFFSFLLCFFAFRLPISSLPSFFKIYLSEGKMTVKQKLRKSRHVQSITSLPKYPERPGTGWTKAEAESSDWLCCVTGDAHASAVACTAFQRRLQGAGSEAEKLGLQEGMLEPHGGACTPVSLQPLQRSALLWSLSMHC